MKYFRRNHQPRSIGQVGISFSSSKLVLAHIFVKDKTPALEHISYIEGSGKKQASILKENVERLNLQGAQASVLLPSRDYQIFLIEEPQVPEHEKREAIRWLVAEYIDFAIEEAVVDFIELPRKVNNDATTMLYVIVAKRSKIDEVVTWVNASDLTVKSIDVCQSALRHIAMQLENSEEGQALLHFEEDRSHLILFKEKKLYMMRDIDLGLSMFEVEDSNQEQHNYQDLSLEIQRSLDYCASNLRNANISRLILTPLSGKKPRLLSHLSNLLGLPVREITFSEFLQVEDNLFLQDETMSTLAIGAALNQNQNL
ncbi:MAG: hypothetical protein BGO43_07005 [Gammaproteobacteria bacterium 39-13]|nr:pilus assembly protein PilM [Gammaproteobacteria bacterium]OJV90584.1 MAG: hypothetical protein BGO43_07005 [Gammaproteobacteria bacterium 39-13]